MNGSQKVAQRYLEKVGASVKAIPLDRSTRNRIAKAFTRAGLDGNGKFRKPQEGYSRALDLLRDFDIEMDDVPSSHLFNGDSGRLSIHLAFTNLEDAFSPTPIKNAMLVITFYQRDKNNFEVLAYIS